MGYFPSYNHPLPIQRSPHIHLIQPFTLTHCFDLTILESLLDCLQEQEPLLPKADYASLGGSAL